MLWLLGIAVGTGIGLLVGLGCKRLPMPPLVQSLTASSLSNIVGTVAMFGALVAFRRVDEAYLGVGMSPVEAIQLAVYLLVVAASHWATGHVAPPPAPSHSLRCRWRPARSVPACVGDRSDGSGRLN